MDLKEVPKSFWHSVSFSLIMFTIGFLYISYESGEIKVKLNNLQIESKRISNNESIIKEKEKKIKELESLLSKKFKELESLKNGLQIGGTKKVHEITKFLKDPKFIKNIEKNKMELEILNKNQLIFNN